MLGLRSRARSGSGNQKVIERQSERAGGLGPTSGVQSVMNRRASVRGTVAWAGLMAAVAGTAGCMVGPDYAKPTVQTPARYHTLQNASDQDVPATVLGQELAPGALAQWWTVFEDATLSQLVEEAVAANHDLRFAEARVRQARALRGVAKSGLGPNVDVVGGATRSQRSSRIGDGVGREENNFQAGFDASWELDVFGGVRREIEAADADLASLVENRRDVMVVVVSEVARNYSEYRSAQQRLRLAVETVRAQQETLDLTNDRFRAGLAADLDVAQARAQLATRQSQLPLFRIAATEAVNRLAVLLGQQPGSLDKRLSEAAQIPVPHSAVPVGLPSELLRRRPDIRRAERNLAAATARIGVATADLYPRFSLNGAFGLQSDQLGDLFNANARYWSIGPAVRWNVFSYGRIKNQIEAAGAVEEQLIASFEQQVLLALEEVNNSVVSFTELQARRAALLAAVEANQRAVDLSTDRYRSGVGDFLNVLESQRQLYDTQDQYVESGARVTTSLIALYKALGGGWEETEETQPVADAATPAENQEPAVAPGGDANSPSSARPRVNP